jgi:hypothetical protein
MRLGSVSLATAVVARSMPPGKQFLASISPVL